MSVSDSVYTSSLTASNINSSGGFSWTPRDHDVGSHDITVLATDSTGQRGTVVQRITVGIATTSITSLSPGKAVTSKQNVTFKVVPKSFTNPMYSVSDSVSGSSINNGNINALGVFSWTPTTNDLGVHLITVKVTDLSGNVSSISQEITVTPPKLEIKSLTPASNINVGTKVTFTATSTGLLTPRFSITDSFGNTTISNTNIATTGVFIWTPSRSDTGMHLVRITAMDNYGSSATAEITLSVTAQGTTQTLSTTPTTASTQTNSATNAEFSRYLYLGSSGADVSRLQTILKQRNLLSGDVTGYFGRLTEQALKNFQSSLGLEQVGATGPATRKALNDISTGVTPSITTTPVAPVIAPTATTQTGGTITTTTRYKFTKPLTIGNSGVEVSELQKKLTSLGVYSGEITGYYGPMTWTAVKALQAKNNLEVVGSIGPGTRAILNTQ